MGPSGTQEEFSGESPLQWKVHLRNAPEVRSHPPPGLAGATHSFRVEPDCPMHPQKATATQGANLRPYRQIKDPLFCVAMDPLQRGFAKEGMNARTKAVLSL